MNIAVQELVKKHDELVAEKRKIDEEFTAKILDIYSAIEILTGKKASEHISEILYDDQNPDYIRNTEDGI